MSETDAKAAATKALLILAMLIWGVNVAAVKVLTSIFDPMIVAVLRMLVACVALTAIVLWTRPGWGLWSWRRGAGLIACAVLMVYLNQVLFVEGLVRSTATNGALIMALSPLVSSLLAALAFRERLTASRLAGVFLGFMGVAAVVLSHPGAGLSRAGIGDLMLVMAVISFASGGAIVQRLARGMHSMTISWLIYAIGTLMLALHAAMAMPLPALSVLFPGWAPWGYILFSGVLATAVANLVWNQAIARIGVARTAIFLYWVPVFGVAFAALFMGETLTPWHLLGFAAVMGGTYLGTRPSPWANVPVYRPESPRHERS